MKEIIESDGQKTSKEESKRLRRRKRKEGKIENESD